MNIIIGNILILLRMTLEEKVKNLHNLQNHNIKEVFFPRRPRYSSFIRAHNPWAMYYYYSS